MASKGKERPFVVLRVIGSRGADPLYEEIIVSCVPILPFKSNIPTNSRFVAAGLSRGDWLEAIIALPTEMF